MRLEWFLCFGGQEISNHARVAHYINNIGGFSGTEVPTDCACASLDSGFSTPWSDPAPWYEITRNESRDFLGFLATGINLQSPVSRDVSPTGRVGSMLSPMALRGRIVQVNGLMWATSTEGMAYGERWLAEALRGSPCSGGECPDDDILVLPACPEQEGYDINGYLRTLVGGGTIDGPQYQAVSDRVPECKVQSASFVLASSQPWLYHQPTRCLDAQAISGTLSCPLTTPDWMGEGTFRIEIENTDSSATTDITIQGQISLDGSCPVVGSGGSVPPSFSYTIPTLAPEDKLIIDGARRQVNLVDASEKASSPGLSSLDLEGPFRWPDVGPCTTMCLTITASGGSATATVDTYLREL